MSSLHPRFWSPFRLWLLAVSVSVGLGMLTYAFNTAVAEPLRTIPHLHERVTSIERDVEILKGMQSRMDRMIEQHAELRAILLAHRAVEEGPPAPPKARR